MTHGGQIDEADAVGKLRDQVRRDLQREPGSCLPHPGPVKVNSGTSSRQEQLSDRSDLPLPANQRGAWQRKRRRTVRQRQGHSHSDPVNVRTEDDSVPSPPAPAFAAQRRKTADLKQIRARRSAAIADGGTCATRRAT